jgi:broad specificity phosphatase PhoE
VETDERLIEAGNYFEGKTFGVGDGALSKPSVWPHLLNPFTPSWGEPYEQIAARMLGAIADARVAAYGHDVVLVSHQLPVWTVRNKIEGKRLWHDPRKRECRLASLTTLTYLGDDLTSVTYAEPAASLLSSTSGGTG